MTDVTYFIFVGICHGSCCNLQDEDYAQQHSKLKRKSQFDHCKQKNILIVVRAGSG